MNIFIKHCNEILDSIKTKDITFDKHFKFILNAAKSELRSAEHIIVCGNTAVGQNCMKHLKNHTKSPVYMWDARNNTGGGITLIH